MKKIDKLVSKAFFGPFLLTFSIVLFILFTVFMSKYFEDLVGKGLGWDVYARLFSYFALVLTPQSLPLAVLLSSLMSFGNLGENYEITALKSAGVSLPRLLVPVAFYALIITCLAMLFNNYVVPEANLKAFSLMYDVRQKKPTMDLKEGGFYNGLQNYSIRVERKDKDGGKGVYGLMIYDHSSNRGNVDVILSDSGTMETINNDTYLVMELRHGYRFSEKSNVNQNKQEFVRDEFQAAKFVFDLSNLGLQETPEELFKGNKVMKDIKTLAIDADSLEKEAANIEQQTAEMLKPYHDFQFSIERQRQTPQLYDSLLKKQTMPADYLKYKDILTVAEVTALYDRASAKVRNLQSFSINNTDRAESTWKQVREFRFEMWTRITLAVSCFMMFLIGAPLGTIIKKGGLGVPTLISVAFFLLYYAVSLTCMRYAHEDLMNVVVAAWTSNFVLLIFGLIFLWQARNDSRLFDFDSYLVLFERLKERWQQKFATKKTVTLE
jgi:lipopolysaccharide export system permease protein